MDYTKQIVEDMGWEKAKVTFDNFIEKGEMTTERVSFRNIFVNVYAAELSADRYNIEDKAKYINLYKQKANNLDKLGDLRIKQSKLMETIINLDSELKKSRRF